MKLYCDKTRARYAAKREFAKNGAIIEAREGEAFEIVEQDGKFGWVVPASVQAPVVEDRPEPTSVPYHGYVLKVLSEEPPKVQVFDPRFSGPAADYETTSLDLAMKWVDAYRDGVTWAVLAKLAPAGEPAAEPARAKRKVREPALAFDVGTGVECDAISPPPKPARKRKPAAAPVPAPEAPANPEPPKAAEQALAPAWPTAFVPDTAAGEIAAREYGLLKTRERAVQAATAAGISDPVITQTCRGDWIWRVQALDKVWRENAVTDAKKPKAERKAREASDAPRRASKLSPKHEVALKLIQRPTGATAAQVAEATGWKEHSARARIVADLRNAFGFQIVKEKTDKGTVYKVAC